jgi:hypothetical protein
MSRISTNDGQPVISVAQVNFNGYMIGEGLTQVVGTLTDSDPHEVFPAGGGDIIWAIGHIHLSNTSASGVLVSVLDGTNPIWETFIASSGGGAEAVFIYCPLLGSTNTAVNIKLGAAVTDVRYTVVAYKTG